MITLTPTAIPTIPPLTVTLSVHPDPQGAQQADQQYGTLSTEAGHESVTVRPGLFFTPAWDAQEEARASEVFLGLSAADAQHEARMRVLQAARRRALCGVTWQYERLTVRVTNAVGEVLACTSVGGIASDLDPATRQAIETELHNDALSDARDWSILGLN